MAISYIGVSYYKTQNKITTSGDDTRITNVIKQASRMIDSLVGYSFSESVFTSELVDRYGLSVSGFRARHNEIIGPPINNLTISSVVEDGTTLTEGEDYAIYGNTITKIGGVWTYNFKSSVEDRGVKLTGTIGYEAENDVPYDLRAVTLEIATKMGRIDNLKAQSDLSFDDLTESGLSDQSQKWLESNKRIIGAY
ncbi:hypothetical protein CL622_03030 [archaeon]|nr:hypothetical protein [archaeon]